MTELHDDTFNLLSLRTCLDDHDIEKYRKIRIFDRLRASVDNGVTTECEKNSIVAQMLDELYVLDYQERKTIFDMMWICDVKYGRKGRFHHMNESEQSIVLSFHFM